MLNLLFQLSNGLDQEVHEVHTETRPHGPLEQVNWIAKKPDSTLGPFLKVGLSFP